MIESKRDSLSTAFGCAGLLMLTAAAVLGVIDVAGELYVEWQILGLILLGMGLMFALCLAYRPPGSMTVSVTGDALVCGGRVLNRLGLALGRRRLPETRIGYEQIRRVESYYHKASLGSQTDSSEAQITFYGHEGRTRLAVLDVLSMVQAPIGTWSRDLLYQLDRHQVSLDGTTRQLLDQHLVEKSLR